MIQISQLYLININDKTPYVLNPDVIFSKLIPTADENQTISELTLREYTFYFNSCSKINFQYETSLDQENKLPFQTNKNLYSYVISGTFGETSNFFTNDNRLTYSDVASDTYQVIFKDYSGNWFICYAEFTADDISIENERIVSITLTAENVKEELYRILTFNLLADTDQFYNIASDGGYILASNGGKTINVD